MIDRSKLDLSIQTRLHGHLDLQVGMSDVPILGATETLKIPYLILYYSPGPGLREYDGSFADPNDMPCFDYLVKTVGRNHQETSATAARVRGVFLNRGSGPNGYMHGFYCGLNVIDREPVSTGVIVPADAPSLFECNDIYRVRVTE